jgi:adenylylsulfate reductase subunit B
MPSFVIVEKCDGCKALDRTACQYICPNDLMVLEPEPRPDGTKRAYNQEPEQCWECYNCVKICPVQAIEVRHYADIMPLGSSTIPLRGTDNIMWTIKFRDQKTIKRFKFPTRTTAEGSIDAFKGQTLPSDVADLKKPGFFTGAARTE